MKDMASRHSRRGGVQKVRSREGAERTERERLAETFSADAGTMDDVMRCAHELARPVRRMRTTYPATAIVLAMLAQTAGTLRSLVQSGHVRRRDAIQYCREFRAYVLGRNASAKGSKPRTPRP
jgi:hypothetical protein